MMKNFFYSTVFKIAVLMFSVSFLAVVSMFSSVFISDGAQTDALAVNVAGSLRMQSYRLASGVQAKEKSAEEIESIYDLMETFEKNLTTGVLVNQQSAAESWQQEELHDLVQAAWVGSIKPMLIEAVEVDQVDTRALNAEVESFVADIDRLVMKYQQHAEMNISTIRLIQSLALFSTLILIAIAMLIVNRHIKQPLSRLTAVAKQIGYGDFSAHAEETGNGELALLARTMNKMSSSIYRSQSQLEEHVKLKTEKLSRINESLNLLFQLTRKLNNTDPLAIDFKPVLNNLAGVTGIPDLDLCIMTAEGTGPYEHLIATDKSLPEKCIKHSCGDCIKHEPSSSSASTHIRYQLAHGGINYGVLSVRVIEETQLEDWQNQLFESVAEQVANGLSMKHQQEQGRRIALMNERTVIARELHDSLAQALSYLKIQVTRLKKLQKKENAQEQIELVIEELKTGLNSAYRELRELLTTFRLKLDGQSLKLAFEQTIDQLKVRSDDFEFVLNYHVGNVPFSPQEEIHLLQIAREATQNAFYHSKGNKIDIDITMNASSLVTLSVADNGVGIPGDPNKQNHYGLAIMHERSRSLNGEINIMNLEEGGTKVVLEFTPAYAREVASSSMSV